MQYQIVTPQWLQVNQQTRLKLKEIFSIPQTGQRTFQQIRGVGEVTCDGHTNKDLATLTLEKMNQYLGEECPDVFSAFAKVVDKVENPLPEQFVADNGSVPVEDITPPSEAVTIAELPICSYCETRGTRHLKSCTRPV